MWWEGGGEDGGEIELWPLWYSRAPTTDLESWINPSASGRIHRTLSMHVIGSVRKKWTITSPTGNGSFERSVTTDFGLLVDIPD